MKRLLGIFTAGVLALGLAACGTDNSSGQDLSSVADTAAGTTEQKQEEALEKAPGEGAAEDAAGKAEADNGKILVIYFSCTGNTKEAAEEIQRQTGADIYEIVPVVPYASEDLNYNQDDCRANREMEDDAARPAIDGRIDRLSDYDTVFIGYPIWWGTMPKIINTLLDTYDFLGKTIIPFCTSGSSGIDTSVSAIRLEEPDAKVLDGLRVGRVSEITDWLKTVMAGEKF